MPTYSDMKTLRAEYISFIQQMGKAKTTAFTTANEIFGLWNNCGEQFFWDTIHADDNAIDRILTDYLETYYPKQIRYISGYKTSIRYFREFLAASVGDSSFSENVSEKRSRRVSVPQKQVQSVLTLTNEMLEEEHKIVLADPGYGTDYALVDSVFKRFPSNTDPELVALKIALVDMTMSTNLSRHRQKIVVTELAEIITGIEDFDVRIQQGDPSLVPIIAKNTGKINLFSFATKYCTFHAVDVYGKDDYVIYDRVVKDALPKYVPGLRKSTLEGWRRDFNYTAYIKCIDDLLDANGINIPFRHRKLDHYLWHKYRKADESDFSDDE